MEILKTQAAAQFHNLRFATEKEAGIFRAERRHAGIWTRRNCRHIQRVDQQAVGGTHKEHGCPPLHQAALPGHSLACLGERAIHRISGSQRLIEGLGQADRGTIRNRELHGNDGGEFSLHQGLGDACKRIGRPGARALTGIEKGQAQGRLIVEIGAQQRSRDELALPCFVFQQQAADLRDRVKCPVADEVKDMNWLCLLQAPLQGRYCRLLQPLQDNQLTLLQSCQDTLKLVPLLCNVETGLQIFGIGDHSQNAQRQLDGQRALAFGQLQVADDRRLIGECKEALALDIIKIFPRQRGQFRRVIKPQANSQTDLLLLRYLQTAA